MPDISVFREKLKALAELVRQELPNMATNLTLNAKALAERRIKESGFNAHYSTTPIPAWFFHGKELNGKGTKWLQQHGVNDEGKSGEATHKKGKKRKKGEAEEKVDRLGTWEEFRQAQGLQGSFVDLSYSNKMWAAMGPLGVIINGNFYSAPLGAGNQQAQQEMNYNFARFGDFIGKGLQSEDFNILAVGVADDLKRVLDSANLQP